MTHPASLEWLQTPIPTPSAKARKNAEIHQASLTKPPGALGKLENIAITLAALQDTTHPSAERIHISVFAGDHGIAAEGVSAFPQAVTSEMIKNFVQGGAAISVAAQALNAQFEIINLGTVTDLNLSNGVIHTPLGPGTANFLNQPAMTGQQLVLAMTAGRQAAKRAAQNKVHLFIGGEMGIANTTAAAALTCALLNETPETLAGPGTGLDQAGVKHKAQVIQRALEFHQPHLTSPLEILRFVGGFEIAALTGAYISAAQFRMPILVDGFISSAAALVAVRNNPELIPWLLFSHTSAEPGHQTILKALNARPLLDLGMRLGEGSGAAVAVPLLRMACLLHNKMATFTEAQVSRKQPVF